MHKAKHLVGLPVIDAALGKQIAAVRSVLVDIRARRIAALVVQRGGLLGSGRAFCWHQIQAIGDAAVILAEGEEAVPLPEVKELYAGAQALEELSGKPILHWDGTLVGTFADVVFDPQTGRIAQIVVSDGILQALVGDQTLMAVPAQIAFGEGNIIIGADDGPPGDLEMKLDPPESDQRW